MKKKKLKIKVNNKLRAFGETDTKTGLIQINVKKHKGDKKQLADTVKHEKYHFAHPNATEKATYKNTGKVENISKSEQDRLLAKLKTKTRNYKMGATKRKLKIKGKTQPGELISRVNETKTPRLLNTNSPMTVKKLAVWGMI